MATAAAALTARALAPLAQDVDDEDDAAAPTVETTGAVSFQFWSAS